MTVFINFKPYLPVSQPIASLQHPFHGRSIHFTRAASISRAQRLFHERSIHFAGVSGYLINVNGYFTAAGSISPV